MAQLFLFGVGKLSLQVAVMARKLGLEPQLLSDEPQAKAWHVECAAQGIPLSTAAVPEQLPIQIQSGDLALSIGAPWFFSREFLERNRNGAPFLNLHGTALPRARGGTLFSWQILSGKRSGICLLHQMAPALDAGEVVDFEEFIYPASCRKPLDYISVYEEKNAAFLERFLNKWLQMPQLQPKAAQPEYLSTYWPRLRADVHGWLDWQWTVEELERFICAFDDPYAGARCRWRNKEIVLKDAWRQSEDGYTHPFQWGTVTRNNGKWLTVAANGGELLLCSVSDTEGRSVLAEIRPGDRLYHTAADLEKARRRLEKTARGLDFQSPKE